MSADDGDAAAENDRSPAGERGRSPERGADWAAQSPDVGAPGPSATDRRRLLETVPSLRRDPIGLPGVALATIGLVLGGGTVGTVVAPVVVACWLLAGPIYAATAAALCFAGLLGADPATATGVLSPGGASPASLASIGVGVTWLVLSPTYRAGRRAYVLAGTVLAVAAAVAVVALASRQFDPTAVAAVLVTAVAAALYLLHRYSLVRLAYRDPQ